MEEDASRLAADSDDSQSWLGRMTGLPLFNGSLSPRPRTSAGLLTFAFVLFISGWVSVGYSVLDVGKYSVLFIYLAALPFCRLASSRAVAFFALPLISTLFALIVAVLSGVSLASIASQAALQLLAIFFGAGIASIDWRRHLALVTKTITLIAIPVVVYGGYQMVARAAHLPYAFLPVTNQQAYATGGLQRGWGKQNFARASSVFVEPSDFGYFCLWLLVLGLASKKGKGRYIALGLAFSGVLFSQSLSAVLGVIILIGIYLATNPINFVLLRQVLIVVLLCVIAILSVQPLMPEAFAKFSDRIQKALELDGSADSGRVDHLPACWRIFKDAPLWGHGLASVNSADENGTDVTSISYALLLMERGTVGTCFFLLPWVLVTLRGRAMAATDPYRNLVLLVMVLHLYCFATFSLAYFLPFWLAIGIAASISSDTHLPRRHLAVNWQRLQESSARAKAMTA